MRFGLGITAHVACHSTNRFRSGENSNKRQDQVVFLETLFRADTGPFKACVLVWPGMCGDNDPPERTE